MRHRGDESAFCFAHLKDLHHKGNVILLFEPFSDRFAQNRRCEGTKRFAVFNFGVQNLFHVGATRVAQNGTIPERARAPFHSPLEPADDEALCDRTRGAGAEFGVVVDMRHEKLGVVAASL